MLYWNLKNVDRTRFDMIWIFFNVHRMFNRHDITFQLHLIFIYSLLHILISRVSSLPSRASLRSSASGMLLILCTRSNDLEISASGFQHLLLEIPSLKTCMKTRCRWRDLKVCWRHIYLVLDLRLFDRRVLLSETPVFGSAI